MSLLFLVPRRFSDWEKLKFPMLPRTTALLNADFLEHLNVKYIKMCKLDVSSLTLLLTTRPFWL